MWRTDTEWWQNLDSSNDQIHTSQVLLVNNLLCATASHDQPAFSSMPFCLVSKSPTSPLRVTSPHLLLQVRKGRGLIQPFEEQPDPTCQGSGAGSASSSSGVPSGPHCFGYIKAFCQIQLIPGLQTQAMLWGGVQLAASIGHGCLHGSWMVEVTFGHRHFRPLAGCEYRTFCFSSSFTSEWTRCEDRSVCYLVNNTGYFLLLYWVNRMIWAKFPGQTLPIQKRCFLWTFWTDVQVKWFKIGFVIKFLYKYSYRK